MRSKDRTLMAAIEKYVNDFKDMTGVSPTIQEVADGVGSSRATVQRYIAQMCEDGIIDYSGPRTLTSVKLKEAVIRVPVLGRVACGIPRFAEENIEEYVRLPISLFGHGDYFILRAYGDSMINAGIEDNDLVLVRKQSAAESGQIVVALIENEATLKRLYPESGHIRLHPENPAIPDIIVKDCEIQGVAIKVIKDLE